MNEYLTSDFPTIAVLFLRKHQLLHIDRSDSRRAIFSFTQTSSLQTDLQQLNAGELRVNPLEFWAAERRVKQLLYSENL